MTTAANRQSLVQQLSDDLLGPLAVDEILECRPSDRYLTGILYAQRSETPPEEQDSLGVGEDEDGDSAEETVAVDRAQRHCSAGLSFAVRANGPDAQIDIQVSAARYEGFWLDEKGNRTSKEGFDRDTKWQRIAFNISLPKIPVGAGTPESIPLDPYGVPGLNLRLHVASMAGSAEDHAITVVLVNVHDDGRAESRREREEQLFFQVELRIKASKNATLIARPSRRSGEDDDLRLIYRAVREFAVGHICGARWNEEEERVTEVATTWLPESVVPAVSPDGDPCLNGLRTSASLKPLSASWLAMASTEDLKCGLTLLPSAYGGWLDSSNDEIRSLPAELQVQARAHVGDGRQAKERMLRAIELINHDEAVREAFQLANKAMVLQRSWARGDADLTWRPFQLGFQLLTLESLARKTSVDRTLMDLLWFPTGGGKTEAYLGLIAFTLFYRRLSKSDPDIGTGCSVIMRYTLRLLTIQQFQRAASLILACEYLRSVAPPCQGLPIRLGAARFGIGLWVGGGATPNTVNEAAKQLMKDEDPTPRQLTQCPACQQGDTLAWEIATRKNKKGEDVPDKILVRCDNTSCPMHGYLPIWTVDEDIYREIPSLVIGTVDKFAQIVRKPAETSCFFGGDCDPPDLIIQDELHLISGPLGTLTGLYETAIDLLCTRVVQDGNERIRVRPKIIGSTATIRRAAEQGRQLFDRSVTQFPPPILDADNSCFAVRDPSQPGRLYVGVTSAGRSPKFTLQAVCGSLLQSVHGSAGETPLAWDPWWTLVAYFNSLRELGGALVMMYDDVPGSIQLYAGLRRQIERPVRNIDELTSRKKQSELRDTLAALDLKAGNPAALDAVLATNMISVGVDVPRLGAMVVNGQPKQIAEYIQATSRVGRSHPGLVVSVYNHSKVRDRSHFETFTTWHSALYRDVEPTSVTPFASRAQDRALHAVLSALIRHTVHGLRTAPQLSETMRSQIEQVIVPQIEARVNSVDPAEIASVRRKLQHLLDHWEERVRGWSGLPANQKPTWWSDTSPERALLISAETHAARKAAGLPNSQAWPTPNSMREVEPGSPFKLIERIRLKDTNDAS